MSSENFDCFLLQQEVTYRKGARSVIFIIFWCAFAALFENKADFQLADYSTCVAYTTTIIHLSVSESGGCLPHQG